MEKSQKFTSEDFVLLLRRFISDEITFEQFENQYWTIYNNIQDEQIQDLKTMFDDIYEMMYMSENDPINKEDKKYGFIGHMEIKDRIAVLFVASNKVHDQEDTPA
jgi:hypothetical protein